MSSHKSALVIGANGYIGSAVCRAFVRAGWRVYGLIRRPEAAQTLLVEEVIPIIGDLSKEKDFGFIDNIFSHTKTTDLVINCTESFDYIPHYHQLMALISHIAEINNRSGVKPLVLWSSGCKDYGTTAVDGASGLEPHTEDSPINPPALVASRATYSMKVLEHTDLFDAVVLRPTNVYGYSSSYYGDAFEFAATSAVSGAKTLRLAVDPKSIMHALHVDDCAEAYVALAELVDRHSITGQSFNISARVYETAETVLQALAKDYGFTAGVEFISHADALASGVSTTPGLAVLFGFSQWVASDKIRNLTGWTNRRMLFSENIHVYRAAYEAALSAGHDDIARIKGRNKMWSQE